MWFLVGCANNEAFANIMKLFYSQIFLWRFFAGAPCNVCNLCDVCDLCGLCCARHRHIRHINYIRHIRYTNYIRHISHIRYISHIPRLDTGKQIAANSVGL